MDGTVNVVNFVTFFWILNSQTLRRKGENSGMDIRHARQTEGCRATEVAVLMRYA